MPSHKMPRPGWASASSIQAAVLLALLLVSVGSDAIVKHQRSDEPQQQSAQQQQQSSSQSSQQQQVSASSSPQQSAASSSGASSGHHQSASSVQSSQPASSAQAAQQQSVAQGSRADQASSYQSMGGYQGASNKAYMDNMAAMASNPEHSYQAAASSVNMALANSGIFGAQNGQGHQAGASQQASSPTGSAQSLNPLHYFYYPASKDSAGQSGSAGVQPKSSDLMSNTAASNYQSMTYPSYADQLSGALAAMNSGAGPEAAASSQDPAYLPQPQQMGSESSSYGSNQQQQQQQQQQHQAPTNQQQSGHQSYGADLASYASQPGISQHQSTGGISFNGPTSSGVGASSDYLNSMSHLQSSQQQNGYHGDLSTSNFGSNNLGGSPASYMPPSGSQAGAQGNQHDLFAQQFNSAASQLSPSSVSPPIGSNGAQQVQQQSQAQQQQMQAGAANSQLFGNQQGASSLFGAQSQPSGGSLFAGQSYLNSFLTPQQYTQLTGQQMPGVDQQMLGSNLMASQSMAGQPGSAINPLSSASSTSAVQQAGSSGKRLGISSFIMPMLALAGLSLLIPTVSSIGTAMNGRKKRSIEDRASAGNRQQEIAFESMNGRSQAAKEMSISEYMDKIERYYSIYKNAVENDDCLNRLICEFGDAVKDITGKSAVVMVIEKLVPTWMTGKVHLFKEAALDNKEGKEKCRNRS